MNSNIYVQTCGWLETSLSKLQLRCFCIARLLGPFYLIQVRGIMSSRLVSPESSSFLFMVMCTSLFPIPSSLPPERRAPDYINEREVARSFVCRTSDAPRLLNDRDSVADIPFRLPRQETQKPGPPCLVSFFPKRRPSVQTPR